MAKYRKSKKRKASHTTHRRRSRRVGAMALSPASPIVKFGSIALGWFFADKINTPIETATGGKVDAKLLGGGEAGLGYLLAFKGKKSTIKTVLGGALIGAGIKKLLTEFGIVSGFRSVPVLGNFNNVPVLGSARRGLNGQLNGYNVPPVPAGLGKIGSYYVPSPVMGGVSDCGDGSGINSDSR